MLSVIKHARGVDDRMRLHQQLLQREAQLGGRLFGPIVAGSRREFFCLDEHTWIWHEEWRDKNGYAHAVMTRYDILPQGIRKAQDNQPSVYITESEARRLYLAIDLYNQIVDQELTEELS